MNKTKRKNSKVSKGMLRMTVGGLILYEAIFTVVILLTCIIGDWIFSTLIIWQGDEWFYLITHFFHGNIYLTFLFIWFVGVVTIVIVHNYRLAQYFQDITEAANILVSDDDTPVTLPIQLQQAEFQLNQIKNESMRNARAAKDAEQRKNDLIVYLAHDLKTPLTSVIGYLSLLQDEKEISPEIQQKYIGIALDKSQRLEDLINEFFDITRFNLTHLTLEKETVNLTRMLEQITFEFNPILEEKGLSWDLSLPTNIQLICDPDKLERVFDNLIRNAVNYSYPNGKITVIAEDIQDGVILRFINNGRTIPKEKLGRLFEQFYRMDSSRKSTTGGSGLGLAIAKDIVLLHGGDIKAESEDEKVIFTVLLPRDCKKIVRNLY